MEPQLNNDFLDQKALEQIKEHERNGNVVAGVVTAFPKNPPPPGIAYSKNFARCQRDGIFAVQVRD